MCAEYRIQGAGYLSAGIDKPRAKLWPTRQKQLDCLFFTTEETIHYIPEILCSDLNGKRESHVCLKWH